MHAPRRIKESKKRFEKAFETALAENSDFKSIYQTLPNCLEHEVVGQAARHLGINWYEGTKDKYCDAVYIIGSKEMNSVAKRTY